MSFSELSDLLVLLRSRLRDLECAREDALSKAVVFVSWHVMIRRIAELVSLVIHFSRRGKK